MDFYDVLFVPSAKKELKAIPSTHLPATLKKIKELSEIPRPYGIQLLKGDQRFFRLRHADYRIIFEVRDETKQVMILKIGHRREIYDR